MVLFFLSILLSVLLTASLAVLKGLYSVGEETHLVGTLRLKSRPFATWISIQTLGLETNQVTMVPPFQRPLNLLSCLFSKNSGTGDGFYCV